jgi:hypothetical protein
MQLIDDASRELLLANGRNRDQDHAPVIKVFNPTGGQTWLFSELDPTDNDTLFGLADLGMGSPELGYVSLAELVDLSGMLLVGLERDLHFKGSAPLSVYARFANVAGRIIEIGKTPNMYPTE